MLTRQTVTYISLFTGIFLIALVVGNIIVMSVSLVPLFTVLIGLLLEQPKTIQGTICSVNKSVWVGTIIEVTSDIVIKDGIGVVVLTQRLPASFELVEGSNIRMVWKGIRQKSIVLSYRVRCSKRGKYSLHPIQWESRHLGSLTQTITSEVAGTSADLIVKPKILNVRRIRGMVSLASSPMPVIDVARIGVATTDFREIRRYVYGDSIKAINWKATARQSGGEGTWPLVNEYEVEGKKTVWIFLDASSYMEVGTTISNPFEYALEATNGVAYYYLDRGYRVGMYIYHHRGELFFPDSGKRQFNKLAKKLIDLRASSTGDDLPRAINKCRRYILGYNPLCIVITRIDSGFTDSLISGAKKLIILRGRVRRRLPIMVISIAGYNLIPRSGKYDDNAAMLRHLELRPLVRRLHGLCGSVLEWNPRREEFGSTLLRHLKAL